MSKDLSDLSLGIRTKATQLIDKCRQAGLDIRILSTFRSIQEQDALYSKGRTASGPKVTNARGGSSWHNFGLAFDIGVFIDGKYIGDPKDLSAIPRYQNMKPEQLTKEFVLLYTRAGVIGEALQLQWGGNWIRFKDWGHFYEEKIPASPPIIT